MLPCPTSADPVYSASMNAPHRTRTFKSGTQVVVPLPEGFAVPAGADVEISRNGDRVTIQLSRDPAEAKQRWLAALDALRALPKPPSIQKRERFEFPDRPGR